MTRVLASAALLLMTSQFSCGGEAAIAEKPNGNLAKGGSGGTASGGATSGSDLTGGRAPTSGGMKATGGAVALGGTAATGGTAAGAGTESAGANTGGVGEAGSSGFAGAGMAAATSVGGAIGCTCDSPGCGVCPADRSVVIEAGVDGFRIDATEVTNLEYAAFLAADPPIAAQPAACAWNGSYVPPNSWPATDMPTLPVVWVDWCDAYAYCKWAKKRLCGQIGGGELLYTSTRDPASSQWYRACSNNGTLGFPYGGSYDPLRCNGKDRVSTEALALPVASQSGCEGGVAGLFDMSGNVWEWEDSCASASGATDSCHLRGGSFWSEPSLMDCPTATESYTRASINKNIGFRCCSSP